MHQTIIDFRYFLNRKTPAFITHLRAVNGTPNDKVDSKSYTPGGDQRMESKVEKNSAYHFCSIRMPRLLTSDTVMGNNDRQMDKDAKSWIGCKNTSLFLTLCLQNLKPNFEHSYTMGDSWSYIMMMVPAPSSLLAILRALEVNTAANNCCLKLASRLVAKDHVSTHSCCLMPTSPNRQLFTMSNINQSMDLSSVPPETTAARRSSVQPPNKVRQFLRKVKNGVIKKFSAEIIPKHLKNLHSHDPIWMGIVRRQKCISLNDVDNIETTYLRIGEIILAQADCDKVVLDLTRSWVRCMAS
ncbi:hypothetical protein BDR06DRAFT_967458 [Suillus hirtellus]|nr:hypothetical protein BDR06DRAFT_967458 [Suillus hirtellus]